MARSGKERDKTTIAKHRAVIASMYLEQYTQAEIGDHLGISTSTVCRDLKAIRQDWVKSAITDFDQLKQRELERIDKLEREYWRAWEQSKSERTTETLRASEKGQKTAIRRTEDQCGDPRFLAGVQWCVTQRCKILGIEAPIKTEANDETKIVVEYVNYNPKIGE